MATAPILGQLGGTQVTTGGINQGNGSNGAVPGVVVNSQGYSPTIGTNTLGPTTTTDSGNIYAMPGVTNGTTSGVPTGAQSMTGTTGGPAGTVDGGTTTTAGFNPTTGAMPTSSTGVQSNGINWANGSNTVTGDFSDTYGNGTGQAITSVLQNMGTSTDSAVQATISNTDLAAQQQMDNIQAQEAAGGVSPNSSTAALAESNFYNQVNSGLQSTIANEELSEEGTLLSSLTNEGSAHGSDSSTLDSIMGGLGDVATLGQSASSATSAISPSQDTSWLDALGAL